MFSFHANTLAFGGQIDEATTPRYLPSQASVTLPPTGGFGETYSGPYKQDFVSYGSARSTVTGNSVRDDNYSTYANVSVYQLDIAGRIQADVLTSSVISKNQRVNGCVGESNISFSGEIVGLVIDGHPIDVHFDPEPYRKHGTFDEFVKSFTKMSEEEAKTYAAAYNWPFDECQTVNAEGRKTFHVPRRCTTGIRASMLRSTTPLLEPGEILGITRRGFSIEVAGLGLLHIGEVLLKAGRRRINLLRVEMGKTLDGTPMSRASLPDAGAEPRLVTTAFNTAPEAFALTGPPGGTTGNLTFASGEGNGTDFVP
jgi:hypothetical protein